MKIDLPSDVKSRVTAFTVKQFMGAGAMKVDVFFREAAGPGAKKEIEGWAWVLSKDSAGGYIVTIGDPKNPRSPIKASFHGSGAKGELQQWAKEWVGNKVPEDVVVDTTGLGLAPDKYSDAFSAKSKDEVRVEVAATTESGLMVKTHWPEFRDLLTEALPPGWYVTERQQGEFERGKFCISRKREGLESTPLRGVDERSLKVMLGGSRAGIRESVPPPKGVCQVVGVYVLSGEQALVTRQGSRLISYRPTQEYLKSTQQFFEEMTQTSSDRAYAELAKGVTAGKVEVVGDKEYGPLDAVLLPRGWEFQGAARAEGQQTMVALAGSTYIHYIPTTLFGGSVDELVDLVGREMAKNGNASAMNLVVSLMAQGKVRISRMVDAVNPPPDQVESFVAEERKGGPGIYAWVRKKDGEVMVAGPFHTNPQAMAVYSRMAKDVADGDVNWFDTEEEAYDRAGAGK